MLSANSRHSFQQPAVLGSGDSGIQIAAVLANAGLRVKLYDVAAEQDGELSPAEAAIERLFQLDPSPLSGIEAASLISPCDFAQHGRQLNEHDLIIEAYDLPQAAKQTWLTRLAPHFSRSALIVSLSQGEPVSELGAVLPAGMRPHFMGARFSAFPRLQRLVELVPTARSEERLVEKFEQFLKNTVGLKPYLVEDQANFSFLPLWLFMLCSAFAHSKSLSAIQREAATALLFQHQGGIYYFLQHIVGLSGSRAAYRRLDQALIEKFGSLLQWDSALDKPMALFSSRILQKNLPAELQQLWNARDWAGLQQHQHPCAVFICRYLRDCWQFLAHSSQNSGLSGKALDNLLYDGLGWGFMPWQLLQEFEPKKVYETTLHQQSELSYPLSTHWRRRARSSTPIYAGDEFTHAASLLNETKLSRQYLYRGDILIWQPQAEIVDINSALLSELRQAIEHARRAHHALMIYHHGSQFGITKNWQQAAEQIDFSQNINLLQDCIMALRMHPRFVIFSGGGVILDAGMALMLQADRVISEADLSWQLTTFAQGLTGIGGIWFEWLRRLPQLSPELSRLQTATVIDKLLHGGGIHSIHGARNMGLLRSHDRYVMNRSQLARMSRKMADAWIESESCRAMRYPLYKPNAEDLEWHLRRSASSPDPQRYRELIALLAAEDQQQVLSLRHFLHSENALFFRYLNNTVHD